MNRYVPTLEEIDLIRELGKREAGRRLVRIEPDFRTWAEFCYDGVILSESGQAQVSFFVYEKDERGIKGELQAIVEAVIDKGWLVAILSMRGERKAVLWQRPELYKRLLAKNQRKNYTIAYELRPGEYQPFFHGGDYRLMSLDTAETILTKAKEEFPSVPNWKIYEISLKEVSS